MILLINAHPGQESLSRSLALAYAKGLASQGNAFEVLHLAELKFDPILRVGYKADQPLEQDLVRAQQQIQAAQHIVFFYPQWWGAAPSLFKGFIDRTFLPGFAFKYRPGSHLWDKYLTGKTAEIWLTSDAPAFYYKLLYFNSAVRWLKTATLNFCGIKTLKVHHLDRIRSRTPSEIQAFLVKAEMTAARSQRA